MGRGIAITGIGLVTAQGVGVEASWRGIVEGRDALLPWAEMAGTPLAGLKVARCGELPRPEDLPWRLWKGLSRTQQLACVAVDEALGRAGLPRRLEGMRAAVFLATTVCGMDVNERFYAQYREARETADVNLMRRLMPWEVGELIARRHRAGKGQVCLTTCVGSAMALANAMDAILLGECDVAIVGGAEAMCRVVLAGFHALKVVAAEGCRPFDANRPGITVGEGAGILILESVEHARGRGAEVLCYVRGVGLSCDAHHLTAPEPTGKEGTRAILAALERAGVMASEVGYVNAHGTGTRDNDAMETRALRGVFGELWSGAEMKGPWVSSTKRATGHTFAAAGAIEAIVCVEALRTGRLPGNWGSVMADAGLDLPVIRGGAMGSAGRVAVSTNFAFGGNNAAVVLSLDAGDAGDWPRKTQKTRKNREGEAGPADEIELGVLGLGVVTDGIEDVGGILPLGCAGLERMERLAPEAVGQMDVIAQLAVRAAHQAWTMAGLGSVDAGRIGLLFVSAWGTMEATVAFLESMLGADGRFASPRHFSRSVYSSVTSLMAIHFGIRGPCETLAFEPSEGGAVTGALEQAKRMLKAGRAERVMIVWAEESGEIAMDLARRAAGRLGRKEFERYVDGLGFGAVAAVVGLGEGLFKAEGDIVDEGGKAGGKPFAMDSAVEWVRGLAGR